MRWTALRRAAAALLVLAGTAAARPAGAAAPLEPVIARWTEAAGGAVALARVHGAVLRWRSVESGVPGATEEWIGPAGWKQVTAQGGDRRELVTRGRDGWARDWNGHVQPLAGRDRAFQASVAWLDRLVFGGGPRALAGAASVTVADSAGLTVLRCAPPGGLPFDLAIDARSDLPALAVLEPWGDSVSVTFADWRAVDGVRVPFLVATDGGESGSPDTTRLERATLGAAPPPAAFAPPAAGPPDWRFASGRAARGIPFDFENGHVMVECRVDGGKPIGFLLDTGADQTVINTRRLAEFGLATFGAATTIGGGNSTALSFARVPRLEVGGVALLHQRVGVLDCRGLERIYGVPLGGLLGYDFLSRFVVVLDYERRTMDLLDPATFAYRGSGARIPIVLEGRQPHARAVLAVPGGADVEGDMIVDTGAADNVNLNTPFVRAHHLLQRARRTPPGAPSTLPGMEKEFFAQTSVRGRIDAITLGAVTLKDVPVNLMMSHSGGYASEGFSGTIGEGVLHRFRSTCDYARSTLWLEPDSAFASPFPARRSFGLSLVADGPDLREFEVSAVRRGSPADSAGFRAGDVVTALDGRPAAELRLVELRAALGVEGSRHALEVRRGDGAPRTLEVTVRLVTTEDP